MILEYDQRIEKYFTDWNYMAKKCGVDVARAVKKRCDQLRAAENVGTFSLLGVGKPHYLKGNLNGCLGVSISSNLRLILELHRYQDSWSISDRTTCDYLIIKGVCDYHGEKYEWLIP